MNTLHDQLRRRQAAAARLESIEIEGRAGLHRDPCAPHLHRRPARPETLAVVADLLGPACALALADGDRAALEAASIHITDPIIRGEISRIVETLPERKPSLELS